jgi:hypothetical protein
MKNLLDGLMLDTESVLKSALILMAIWSVIQTWSKTRSALPTLGAALLSAVVIGVVFSFSIVRGEVEKEIEGYLTTPTSTPLEQQGGG